MSTSFIFTTRSIKLLVTLSVLLGSASAGLFFPLSDYTEVSTIEHIEISYNVVYLMGKDEEYYTIEKRGKEYYSNTGRKIDAQLIQGFAESFTDFYESDDYESGYDYFSMTDSYPRFTIVVTHTTGSVTIRSSSNFHCFIPWNIEYNGTNYVQYNGEIPTALLKILIALDEDWLEYEKFARWGCYSAELPERYAEKSVSFFPKSHRAVSPEEERGASHVVWMQDIGEYIIGPPLYAGGTVFVTEWNRVFCFDGMTGEPVWEAGLEDSVQMPIGGAEYVTFRDERLFVTVGSGLLCFDAGTGEKLWEVSGRRVIGPPVHRGDRIFVRVKHARELYITPWKMGIVCLDAYTGEKIWEFSVVESEKYSTYVSQYMQFDEGRIYFGTGEPSAYCLDAETGEVIWKYAGKAWQLEISGDYILVIREWRGGIVCLRRETGEPVWELGGMTYNRVYDDIVLVEIYDDIGYHGFIDRATGELLWRGDIYGGFYTQGYADGIFYFRKDGGKALVAFNMKSGKQLWQYRCETRMGRVNLCEQGILVQVLDSRDSTLHYIKKLVFLDFSGQVLWEHSCEDVMCGYSGILMEGDILFFFRNSGFIGAIDAETGTQLWEIEIRGTEITDFTLHDTVVYAAADVRVIEKRLYICASDGMVYCIHLGSGEILWAVDTESRLYTHEGRAPPYFFALGNILFVYTEDGHICAISVD